MNKEDAVEYNRGLLAAIFKFTDWIDEHPGTEPSEQNLDELWDVVYHITGYARPVASWTPGAWTRYQATNT